MPEMSQLLTVLLGCDVFDASKDIGSGRLYM